MPRNSSLVLNKKIIKKISSSNFVYIQVYFDHIFQKKVDVYLDQPNSLKKKTNIFEFLFYLLFH